MPTDGAADRKAGRDPLSQLSQPSQPVQHALTGGLGFQFGRREVVLEQERRNALQNSGREGVRQAGGDEDFEGSRPADQGDLAQSRIVEAPVREVGDQIASSSGRPSSRRARSRPGPSREPLEVRSFTDEILPIIVDERDAWHVENVRPRSRRHPPCAFDSRQCCATGTLRDRNASEIYLRYWISHPPQRR
jgi:hypothetical protein